VPLLTLEGSDVSRSVGGFPKSIAEPPFEKGHDSESPPCRRLGFLTKTPASGAQVSLSVFLEKESRRPRFAIRRRSCPAPFGEAFWGKKLPPIGGSSVPEVAFTPERFAFLPTAECRFTGHDLQLEPDVKSKGNKLGRLGFSHQHPMKKPLV